MGKPKKGRGKSKKKKNSKKRTYNEMIEENKKINDPSSNENKGKEEIEKLEKIQVKYFKENKNNDNISLIKNKPDINFPTEFNFDKTHMPSLELIKNNEETRNQNIPIYSI